MFGQLPPNLAHRVLSQTRPNRRQFLTVMGGAGVGLMIGVSIPRVASAATSGDAQLNPFVIVRPDDTVLVLSKHLDKGQGAATGLTTLVAEELDASWEQMRVDFAPADASKYNNLEWGAFQGTGGSSSISNAYMQYREAGAMARALLVEAAAAAWGVPTAEITVAKGVMSHPSGKSSGFGAFAGAAAALPAPATVVVKSPEAFTYIGKSFPRLDIKAKTEGAPLFTLDHSAENMLVAAIARPPKFGATAKAFDATEAKQVAGVVDVIQIPAGVAVVAKSTWPAFKGREALSVEWDESAAETRGTDELRAQYAALLDQPGAPVEANGDADAALAKADKIVEGVFEFPYLAHAPMEPHDAVIEFDGQTAEVWTGCQMQTGDQFTVAAVLGIEPQNVSIHTLWAGGSFGRRAIPDSHIVGEAAQLAKAWGKKQPLKIQWSREDDVKGGYYRPMYLHKVRAGLDAEGNIVGWSHRIVGQSILKGTAFEEYLVHDGVDATSVEGVAGSPYAIPNIAIDLHTTDVGVPVLWWRSVGHTHTAFVMETMMDDLAHAAGRDPVEFRLAYLKDKPRHAGVLKLAAEKAGWGGPVPEGMARGVAVHESFKSYVAQVVDVALGENGAYKVKKVVCAVDCGVAVNPDNIAAQMEGGIGFGLGHAMRDEITLTGGEVDQSNFYDYEPLRITDMPEVEVHIVASAEAPTGVGEPGVPPVAPAVSNAIFAGTGKRWRRLPFTRDQGGGA